MIGHYPLSDSAVIFAIRSRTNSLVAAVAFSRLMLMSFFFAGARSDFGSDMTCCSRSHSLFRSSSESLSSR